MALATDHFPLSLALSLHTPSGAPLALTTGELTVLCTDDDRVGDCCWRFHLGADAYRLVERESLLHLAPEQRGTGAESLEPGPGPGPGDDTEIEARLAPALLADWPPMGDAESAAAWLRELSQTQPDHPCFRSESWYALSVLRAVGLPEEIPGASLKSGYRTGWADQRDAELLSMGAAPSSSLSARLSAFFEAEGWEHETSVPPGQFRLRHEGQRGAWGCLAITDDGAGLCIFYSEHPRAVAATERPRIQELVTRINAGLPIGNFELDLDEGQVRFKTSIDVEGDRLSVELIRQLVADNLEAMDLYLPAFALVLDEGLSPQQAVERAEAAES